MRNITHLPDSRQCQDAGQPFRLSGLQLHFQDGVGERDPVCRLLNSVFLSAPLSRFAQVRMFVDKDHVAVQCETNFVVIIELERSALVYCANHRSEGSVFYLFLDFFAEVSAVLLLESIDITTSYSRNR